MSRKKCTAYLGITLIRDEPVNPLICPKCQGEMRIIAFIEDEQVIKKILKHLGLRETHNHDPPLGNLTHIPEMTYDDDYSQLPAVDYWLQ